MPEKLYPWDWPIKSQEKKMTDLDIAIFLCLVTFVLGWKTPEWIGSYLIRREEKKLAKSMSPSPADEALLCREPHKWVEVQTINREGKVVPVNVCDVCGFIPSTDMIANPEALTRARKAREERQKDEKLINDFTNIEENDLKELFADELKNGMNFDKVVRAYYAGQTLQKRFILYKIKQFESNKTDGRGRGQA